MLPGEGSGLCCKAKLDDFCAVAMLEFVDCQNSVSARLHGLSGVMSDGSVVQVERA